MGANPTQAYGAALLMIALTLISVGLAEDIGVIWVLLGLVAFAISIALFMKCKPLEEKEDQER
jgi:phosphate/sulfate permease